VDFKGGDSMRKTWKRRQAEDKNLKLLSIALVEMVVA